MVEIKFEEDRASAYDDEKKIGECIFIEETNSFNIVRTSVSELYQGQGIARKLVECVMENIKDLGKNVVATCSYAKKIIEKL